MPLVLCMFMEQSTCCKASADLFQSNARATQLMSQPSMQEVGSNSVCPCLLQAPGQPAPLQMPELPHPRPPSQDRPGCHLRPQQLRRLLVPLG